MIYRILVLCWLSLAVQGCAAAAQPLLLLVGPLAVNAIVNTTHRLVTGEWPKNAYEENCLPAPKTSEWRDWCARAKPSVGPLATKEPKK